MTPIVNSINEEIITSKARMILLIKNYSAGFEKRSGFVVKKQVVLMKRRVIEAYNNI
jgi:hypothetical protein